MPSVEKNSLWHVKYTDRGVVGEQYVTLAAKQTLPTTGVLDALGFVVFTHNARKKHKVKEREFAIIEAKYLGVCLS